MRTLHIPSEYIKLCEEWHSGQSSMFYAISSTGALSLGTHSKIWGEQESDEAWMYGLIETTISEIKNCIKIIEERKGTQEEELDRVDEEDLYLFEEFLSYMEIKKVELEKTVLGILV